MMQSLKGVPKTRIPLSPSPSSLDEDEFPSIDDLLARFTLTRAAPASSAPTPTRQTPQRTRTPRRAAPTPSTSTRTSTLVGSRLAAPTAPAAARSPRPVPSTPCRPPSTPTKNQLLADELFPTPPRATPLSTPARRERSPTHVSDSEPEHFLPSARKPKVVQEEESRSARRPRPSFLIEDSEDERTAASAPLFKLTTPTADDDVLILDPATSKARPLKTPSRAARKLTITLDSDSDSDSPAFPAPQITSPRAIESISICGNSSDEEGESDGNETVALEYSVHDPMEGVLSYEPAPRSTKPTRLAPTPSRPPLLNRVNSIDLTLSDDSDDGPTPTKPRSRGPLFSLALPTAPLTSPSPPRKTLYPRPQKSLSAPLPASTKLLTASDRLSLPLELIRSLDRLVFRRQWDGLEDLGEGGRGLPDGIEVRWNARLLKTAGRAIWKRVKNGGVTTHETAIELATKVTDTPEKLRHTLAHELCHVAAWVLSCETKPAHGHAFKLWAKRITLKRPDILITTTHSYKISHKFNWRCDRFACGKTFGRHSNSIDPRLQGCPCGGHLLPVDADGNLKALRTPAKKTAYQQFVSATAPQVRLDNPGVPQAQVFKICAELWREKGKLEALEKDMGRLKV